MCLSLLVLLLAFVGTFLQAETMVSCSAGGITVTNSSSCNLTGNQGASSSASATEIISLSQGIFEYQASTTTVAKPSLNDYSSAASSNVTNILDLNTGGPPRAGYFVEILTANSTGADSGVNWSGSTSITTDGFTSSCEGGNGNCPSPSPTHLFPTTLGGSVPFSATLTQRGFSSFVGGQADGIESANIGVEFREADGVTRAPIISVAEALPEPSTLCLTGAALVICALLIARKRRRGTLTSIEEPRKTVTVPD